MGYLCSGCTESASVVMMGMNPRNGSGTRSIASGSPRLVGAAHSVPKTPALGSVRTDLSHPRGLPRGPLPLLPKDPWGGPQQGFIELARIYKSKHCYSMLTDGGLSSARPLQRQENRRRPQTMEKDHKTVICPPSLLRLQKAKYQTQVGCTRRL